MQEHSTSDILDGYVPEDHIAAVRGCGKRALRSERQKGMGPPFVKFGKRILYPVEGFRAWLKAIERTPVRSPRPHPTQTAV
jgi:hypothetical protein